MLGFKTAPPYHLTIKSGYSIIQLPMPPYPYSALLLASCISTTQDPGRLTKNGGHSIIVLLHACKSNQGHI